MRIDLTESSVSKQLPSAGPLGLKISLACILVNVNRQTKHGPRLDDALKKETRPLEQGAPIEPRVHEDREKEPPGEYDRDVDARTAPPGALGSDQVKARRELSRHLRRSVFPAARDALLAEAEAQNAPEPVLTALRSLPADLMFSTVHEIWAALEGHADVRETAAHEPLTDGDR
ncbi:MAG: DUF2795 domain-containing protein [Actinomycetota bacterium]|nr:DUF2795 domain-containing protein [Actinomycetota bacterium]